MTERAPARILLVDDDPSLLSVLEVSLRGEGYEVRSESDGRAIESAANEFRPDLAVLDVRLAVGPHGYAIARRLRAASEIPILFLTVADTHEERRAGFEAGADDYLTKPFEIDELLWRLKALLRRSGRMSSPVRQIGDLVLDDETHTVTRAGRRLELTPHEYELLSALVQNPGRVLSKDELLQRAWGSDIYGSNVVEVYVSSLRRKLESEGRRLIYTVRGRGYVLRL